MAVIGTERIVREPGYLYYIKNGYVWRSPLKTNPNGKPACQVGTEKLNSAGKMCYLNKQGYAETK